MCYNSSNKKGKLMQSMLPHWEELPKLELYADQVLSLINPLCEIYHVKPLTKAMINNYVKLGLIPPPKKKRYQRLHIAYLFVIAFLKEGFDISLIKEGILKETKRLGLKEGYNAFIDALMHALNEPQDSKLLDDELSPIMFHATQCIAHQKRAQQWITSQTKND
jgi:DNA-binding transcriptional MerR regulator